MVRPVPGGADGAPGVTRTSRSQWRNRRPYLGSSRAIVFVFASRAIDGRDGRSYHDQMLRNQIVGRTAIAAVVEPRLVTRRRIRMSSGSAFAYSTSTSKYRLSANALVS